ncbi:hypothetical protein Fmac_009621 [Flemingia macrophylla]|uniref:Uncharacterized protein n=1 Tax=Flemingia macrophylla TaxID=520843 RepID=A0ABD1N0S1_9FABA
MEDLFHASLSSPDDNSSSSSDISWKGPNEVKKVQFSGAGDHGGCERIDSFCFDFVLFSDDPSEEGYLQYTNQQKFDALSSYHDYGELDNLQFDMASPPLQFEALFPTMVPLCDSTKDKPNSVTPLASLEILKNHGKGFKSYLEKALNEDIMRIVGTRFIQSSSLDSEPLPFLENHPFGSSFFGLSDEEKEDVALVESLLASAEKVGYQQFKRASKLLSHCESLSCKTGSPAKRIVHYFAEALHHRIDRETGRDLPFCQIALFTAVQAIIEDVAEATKIHVIDLEIRKGGQWTILMQELESRQCLIELLKITAIGLGTTRHIVEDTGNRLKEFAQGLNIPFSFNIVMVSDLLQLREDYFEIDPEEAIAVYSQYALRTIIQHADQLETIMKLIRTFSPNIMVVAEIEANHNSKSFVNPFIEALFYFSAFFDCLEACMKDEKNRMIIESLYFSHGIRNIVATEGVERKTRNVKIDVWRAFFSRFGMMEQELSSLSLYQAELVAKTFPCGSFCTFDKNRHSLLVGWKGTPINSVSAWKFL